MKRNQNIIISENNEKQPISNSEKVENLNSKEREIEYLKTEVYRLKFELNKIKGNSKTCMETCASINSIHDGFLRFVRFEEHGVGKLRCIYGNDSIRNMLGFELPDIIGRSLKWFFSPNPVTHRKVDFFVNKNEVPKGITLETYFKSKFNSEIPVLCSIKHNNEKNLKKREYLVIVVDIRVLKSAQENTKSILHAERISTLGHLASGIAHEINNPLSFLLMDLERQKELYKKLYQNSVKLTFPEIPIDKFELKKYQLKQNGLKNESDKIIEELQEISNAANDGLIRISDVVKAVKTYGKSDQKPKRKNKINLEETIDIAIRLIKSKIKKSNINLVKSFSDQKLPLITANSGRLVQVILNLLLNSIQAIEHDHGKIEITTKLSEDENQVRIEIHDNGKGISQDNINRIFEPYFTTKADGTGLGLGIINNIIHDIGGKVSVSSEVNIGTKFIIFLPIKKRE